MKRKVTFQKQAGIVVIVVLTTLFWLGLPAQGQKKAPPQNGSFSPAGAASECGGVGDNLVTNCGFESGDLTGWSSDDPTYIGVAGYAAHSGSFGAFLGAIGSTRCIQQRLATNPGQFYTLSFWLTNSGRPNNFQVYWGGGEFPIEVSGDMVNMPDFPYTKYTLPGLRADGSDRVFFCARNDPSYFYLDDVVVH